jgi:ribosomal protein S18 acetylase RimI-like enzyme
MTDPVDLSMRAASPDDGDFLWKVYASTRQQEVAMFGWPPEQQISFLEMQYRARTQSYSAMYPDAENFVLLAAGDPAGYMMIGRDALKTTLVDIALLPEFRNRGVGTRAVASLMEEARGRSLPLRLSVARGNPAMRLYQRLGFSVISADAVYIEMEYQPCPH